MSALSILIATVQLYAGPIYPPSAAEAGIEAVCVIHYDVDSSGYTSNICSVCNTTQSGNGGDISGLFEASILEAIRTWRYESDLVARRDTARFRPSLEILPSGETQWVTETEELTETSPRRVRNEFTFLIDPMGTGPDLPRPEGEALAACARPFSEPND